MRQNSSERTDRQKLRKKLEVSNCKCREGIANSKRQQVNRRRTLRQTSLQRTMNFRDL